MAGLEPGSSGVRSNRFANCAITTTLNIEILLYFLSVRVLLVP